jgi:hypothetical protein
MATPDCPGALFPVTEVTPVLPQRNRKSSPNGTNRRGMLVPEPRLRGLDPVSVALTRFKNAVVPKLGRGGSPEAQLRNPLEELLKALSEHIGLDDCVISAAEVDLVPQLRLRADYAIHLDGPRVGLIELKRPGTGVPSSAEWASSTRNEKQWAEYAKTGNVLYTDGLQWGRYQFGQASDETPLTLSGTFTDLEPLQAPGDTFISLIAGFLLHAVRVRSQASYIRILARLCSRLRNEIHTVLDGPSSELRAELGGLKEAWTQTIFPELEDDSFADACAQTVTFGLLLAHKAKNIDVKHEPLNEVARRLSAKHLVIGHVLSTFSGGDASVQMPAVGHLRTFVTTREAEDLQVDEVDDDGWVTSLYPQFYEDFIRTYDPAAQTDTGSFATPREVAKFMTRLTDRIIRDELHYRMGFADKAVTVLDPAMGTGTFVMEVIDRVAATVRAELGPGRIKGYLRDLVAERLNGFEIQVAPYAVAELQVQDKLRRYDLGEMHRFERRFFTNALTDPHTPRHRALGQHLEALQAAQDQANQIKQQAPIVVVLGNPPHLADAKGRAPWIERRRTGSDSEDTIRARPSMDEFRIKGRGHIEADLMGLAWYFLRWSCWKVFEADPEHPGVITLILPGSLIHGSAFEGVREYLRKTCDLGWIVNISPEGSRPPVQTRLFKGVGSPLCIAVFARGAAGTNASMAHVRYAEVQGSKEQKLQQLDQLESEGPGWHTCDDSNWRVAFRPEASQGWSAYPALDDLLPQHQRGLIAGRTWVYGPTEAILRDRWDRFMAGTDPMRRKMFHGPRVNKPDLTIDDLPKPLPGYVGARQPLARERRPTCPPLVRTTVNPFDQRWLIADTRLLKRPSRTLWRMALIPDQIFVMQLNAHHVRAGPAVLFSDLVPDCSPFGSGGGQVHPLWDDRSSSNLPSRLLRHLSAHLGMQITEADLMAYIAAITAHREYTQRFDSELKRPGVRIPLSIDADIWRRAIAIGQRVIWLHTFGTRYADATKGLAPGLEGVSTHYRVKCLQSIIRLAACPRRPKTLWHDKHTGLIHVVTEEDGGTSAQFGPVPYDVMTYTVNGKNVLERWLDARASKTGPRPMTAPDLDELTVGIWDDDLNAQFQALLAVLTGLCQLEDEQGSLLREACEGETLTLGMLKDADALG